MGNITLLATYPTPPQCSGSERPLFAVMLLRGNRPPVPTCPHALNCSCRNASRLSSASRSRMRSEKAIPFRTSTLLRIAVGRPSHTTFAQRGSVCIKFTLVSIPASKVIVNGKFFAKSLKCVKFRVLVACSPFPGSFSRRQAVWRKRASPLSSLPCLPPSRPFSVAPLLTSSAINVPA
jgi:hypothetical protein